MNPVMFIPFIPVQPVLTIITSLAYYSGLIRLSPTSHLDHAGRPGAFFNTNGSIMALLLSLFNGGRHRDLSAVRGDLQQGAEPDRRGDGKRRRHRQGAQILTVERGGVAREGREYGISICRRVLVGQRHIRAAV